MKKILVLSLISLLPGLAQAGDLVLPGEKWLATFDKYICAAFSPAVSRPSALDAFDVKFEQVTTDSTLDNALLKASFVEQGVECRYNAILFADNAAQTFSFVQSIAYAPSITNGSAYKVCNAGKAMLDAAFQAGPYLYYGHPHNVAFMLPGVGAEQICGNGSEAIGANFVVKGIVRPAN